MQCGRVVLAFAVTSFALACTGCVSHWCWCDDEEVNPRRDGYDGRRSAGLERETPACARPAAQSEGPVPSKES